MQINKINSVLHITPSYKPAFIYGGPTVSITELCENTALRGVKVKVLTTLANGQNELPFRSGNIYLDNGVEIIYCKRWTGDHSHFSPKLLWVLFWRKIKKNEIIHIHSWWNTVAIFSVIICLLKGHRPIVSPRGMLSAYSIKGKTKIIFHKYIGQNILRKCILHATCNQEQLVDFHFMSTNKVFIAPNIVNFPQVSITDHNEVSSTCLNLIFLSRIDEKKGLEILFNSLSKFKYNWVLTIAGTGKEEYINKLKLKCFDLNITEKVNWIGWLNSNDKYIELSKNDLFVLTSYNENFANAALEALSIGLPVLLSDMVGLSEYILNTGFGEVCKIDEDSILNALIRFTEKKSTLQPEIIRNKVRDDFQKDKVVDIYLTNYQNFK